MSRLTEPEKLDLRSRAASAVAETKVTDIHTHIYDPTFGGLLLWGIDDLLVYHYLVAETMRWVNMPLSDFWAMPKRTQADLVWKTLFVGHVPMSESCRGVLTCLDKLGLDVRSRSLDDYRAYFAGMKVEEFIDKVFEAENVESVVMTNDPFDDLERPVWIDGPDRDSRFHAALRLDAILDGWHTAVPKLREWGYDVEETVHGKTIAEVQRFMRSWVDRIKALYMAVSLPPSFCFPENSPRGRLIEHCVLPVAQEKGIPFATMIGVKKLTNPKLKLAGDSVGKGDIDVVEYLCANYPDNKFLVTMLARENQHELCVAARKFSNLMVFGCWWFLNNPIFIREMTEMRVQMLGPSVIPQHSDARVLDQVIYKWEHAKSIISDVLADQLIALAETGWSISDDELRRDVAAMFGGNFWTFLKK